MQYIYLLGTFGTFVSQVTGLHVTLYIFRFIVDKIDKNKDGEVTEEELREWIQYVQKRYITTDTDRMWKDHEVEDGTLTWESYKKRTYGFDDGKNNSLVHCMIDQF